MAEDAVTVLLHDAGPAPCGRVAQHATPGWLAELRRGLHEHRFTCLGCHQLLTSADVREREGGDG